MSASKQALAEVLQGLFTQEQDHQIDLASALGVGHQESQRKGEDPKVKSK